MRVRYGLIKPRRLGDAADRVVSTLILLWSWLTQLITALRPRRAATWTRSEQPDLSLGLQAN
jgi:hypothetical protein